MVTHLEWSDAIGKRVRSGDWADQAISTVVKIEEELQAAGDEFGLAANRSTSSTRCGQPASRPGSSSRA